MLFCCLTWCSILLFCFILFLNSVDNLILWLRMKSVSSRCWPVAPPVRQLLLYICGSKEKYRQLRDMHALQTHMGEVRAMCDTTPHLADSAPLLMPYDTLITLVSRPTRPARPPARPLARPPPACPPTRPPGTPPPDTRPRHAPPARPPADWSLTTWREHSHRRH